MNEHVQAQKAKMSECEAEIYRHSGTVGVSAVSEYIELRKADLQASFLHTTTMVEVAEIQGRVRELDALQRRIQQGPHKIG